jgi:3alpha(or 20beta)-hydroxysteroid dehydrogenase
MTGVMIPMSSKPDPTRRVAFITGGAKGIGRATAAAFVRAGHEVFLFDMPGSGAEQTLADVCAGQVSGGVFEGDVSIEADWRSAKVACLARLGRIDVLVNNAGISGPLGPLIDCEVADFDRVHAVNTRGTFLGMKIIAPSLPDGEGAIVNVSSISGLGGGRNMVAYTASKHAVVGMTKLAAMELADRGVRVNAVCPAPTHTDMTQALAMHYRSEDPDGFSAEFAKFIPMGRYGQPSEIADAIVFLSSPAASFITGVALPVDGGALAR